MDQYGETPIGGYEHPLMDHDDGIDDFDWMATLAAAGIPSRERDLSHMGTADMIALLAAEDKAAIDLARLVGLWQEWDAVDRSIPVDLTDEAQARMLETINAVPISKDHLAAHMRIVDLIPAAMKAGGQVLARSALERAEELGLSDPGAPLRLLARSIALDRWREDHDLRGDADKGLLIEAAAGAPVIFVAGKPAFDGPSLRKLIDFLSDLPW